jgi:hypothetical protein
LVRARRWATSRRNSKVWRFFCSGKVAVGLADDDDLRGLELDLLAGRGRGDQLADDLDGAAGAQLAQLVEVGERGRTHGLQLARHEPSLTSRNTTCLLSRTVRSQPLTRTPERGGSSLRTSTILVRGVCMGPGG